MSGQAPYGYQLEPTVVEGIRTKKMVAAPVAADHVRLMFEMYAEPEILLRRYYQILRGTRYQDLREVNGSEFSFPAFAKPRLRTGRLGTVRVFQEPGRGDCQ